MKKVIAAEKACFRQPIHINEKLNKPKKYKYTNKNEKDLSSDSINFPYRNSSILFKWHQHQQPLRAHCRV